jgi:nicotinamide mononucleotide transporter
MPAFLSIFSFFSIDNIAFKALDYAMSWLELTAAITGVIAVWLSARAHIASWGVGLVNVVLTFVLFYKIGLYADMFLQIYFFITGILGWWLWQKKNTETQENQIEIGFLTRKQQLLMAVSVLVFTVTWGAMMEKLPVWLPNLFTQPTSFPYADSLVVGMSVFGNLLLTRKKIESWVLWVLVDILAPILYFKKGILLITFEYLIFLALALFALYNWLNLYKKNKALK